MWGVLGIHLGKCPKSGETASDSDPIWTGNGEKPVLGKSSLPTAPLGPTMVRDFKLSSPCQQPWQPLSHPTGSYRGFVLWRRRSKACLFQCNTTGTSEKFNPSKDFCVNKWILDAFWQMVYLRSVGDEGLGIDYCLRSSSAPLAASSRPWNHCHVLPSKNKLQFYSTGNLCWGRSEVEA